MSNYTESVPKDLRIVPTALKYSDSYNQTLATVAAEGRYLSVTKGFDAQTTRKFVENCMRVGDPQYFLIDENERVVGWCDIVRREEYTDGKVGSLGVGLLDEYRNAGLGRLLIKTTLDAARQQGFDRVVLDVRENNGRAVHVYELLGFERLEGEKEMEIGGVTEKVITMSLPLGEIVVREEQPVGKKGLSCLAVAAIVALGLALGVLAAVLKLRG